MNGYGVNIYTIISSIFMCKNINVKKIVLVVGMGNDAKWLRRVTWGMGPEAMQG